MNPLLDRIRRLDRALARWFACVGLAAVLALYVYLAAVAVLLLWRGLFG